MRIHQADANRAMSPSQPGRPADGESWSATSPLRETTLVPRHSADDDVWNYSVVSTMSTEHGAPCATEFGTLPSTRRTPFIPRLPTTTRSAPTSSAR